VPEITRRDRRLAAFGPPAAGYRIRAVSISNPADVSVSLAVPQGGANGKVKVR